MARTDAGQRICDMSQIHHGRDYTERSENENPGFALLRRVVLHVLLRKSRRFELAGIPAISIGMTDVLLIGDSGGIGGALKQGLKKRGARVTGLSRRRDGLDFQNPAEIDRIMAAQTGPYDMILVATGVLNLHSEGPEKNLRAVSAEEMAASFAVNCIGPALVLRHAPRLLRKQGVAKCAVLSARVGSIGDNKLGGWHSYRASKAALNQVVRCAAIELARGNKQSVCVALHPGTVQTKFSNGYPAAPKVTPEAAAENLLDVLNRLGPKDTGGFFDWRGDAVAW